MRKSFLLLTLIFILQGSIQARESKIMKYLGNFIPSLSEIGILTNCVNVYDKVSQFVRVTNKMVRSVKQAKSDWERVKYNIEEIYEDIRYLKNIDPYDMDTWQAGLSNFSFSLRSHSNGAVSAFEMFEAHTLDAGMNYAKNVSSITDYTKEIESKKSIITSIYTHPSYSFQIAQSAEVIKAYRRNTLSQLRALQSADILIMENSIDPQERQTAQDHLDAVTKTIENIESSISKAVQMEKPDSIIEQTSNLIAINLTEIKICNERIQEMINSSSNLVAGYYRLLGQNLNSQISGNSSSLPDIPINPLQFDASDPDKVSIPKKPEVGIENQNETSRKEISNHDILNLNNAASLLSLKQECLKRDILAMKANTMAFIVTMEANRRNISQLGALSLAHHFRMIELAMEDLK